MPKPTASIAESQVLAAETRAGAVVTAVFVVDKHNTPLMPTKPGKAREWLQSGRAVVTAPSASVPGSVVEEERAAVLDFLAQLGDPILAEVERQGMGLRQAAETFHMSEARTIRFLERRFDEFTATTVLKLLHRVGLTARVALAKPLGSPKT